MLLPRSVRWLAAALLVVGGCAKKPVPTGPRLAEDELLRVVRERATPEVLQGRFSIKMRSPKLGIVAPRLAGALILQRPTNAWIAVYDPVGSPVIQLASDGDRVIFINSHDREAVVQEGTGDVLAEATGGRFGMQDIVDVVLGRLPLHQLQLVEREETPEGMRYGFEGPEQTKVRTWLDAVAGTPTRIEVDGKDGALALTATYPPFTTTETGAVLPAGLAIEVPSVELTLDLVFKTWKVLDAAPDVFAPPAPDGYEVMDFPTYGERSKERMKNAAPPVGEPAPSPAPG